MYKISWGHIKAWQQVINLHLEIRKMIHIYSGENDYCWSTKKTNDTLA